jgi:hypothetical protein
MSLIGALTPTPGFSSVFGTGATQSFQGMYGGGFAAGGTYRAPMTGGGPDSIPVLFRMSPGETAAFTPQGQQAAGGGGRDRVVMIDDRRALSTAKDEEDVLRIMLKHRHRLR